MNSSRFTLCTLAGAVTLALQVQAFAEESTIVVTGSEQGSALPAWTNSATKSAVAESKTPQVINTLSAPEIEKRHANSVNEILRYAPGVSTEVRGNTSYMSEYKIRGFTVDQEFYNGLQLPYNVTGNTKARSRSAVNRERRYPERAFIGALRRRFAGRAGKYSK